MTVSRTNIRQRHAQAGEPAPRKAAARFVPLASAISAILAGAPVAHAQQQAGPQGALEEVVVTAQKRTENMQDVPVAIVALGTEKLEELHVQNLDDYVKYLPSVAYSRGDGQGGNGQPGSSHVYMRGVVSGQNENHSGSQPSVGTYLDEQPVTTIDGTVDVHIYDIARVEVLEGPQGTLYGASSEAGTIRIITNKPDPAKFSASYDISVNSVDHGKVGYGAEGYVNLPLSPVAAVRLVAWAEHDAGFISNVAGSNATGGISNGNRCFPSWAGATGGSCAGPVTIGSGWINNAAYVKKDYNTVDTAGGRAALKINLGDNWTVTPTVMGQSVRTEGFFGYDPVVGDLQLAHFGPENSQDSWVQAALTVEGKMSDFDLVYAGAFMKRTIHSIADYSDYSYFYDTLFGSGALWRGNSPNPANPTGGAPIMGQELVVTKGEFQKVSHEIRLQTPQDRPVKATVGFFLERQMHDIYEQYSMPGYGFTDPYGSNANPAPFAAYLSIPTVPNAIWLTDEQRVDFDHAAFAQLQWDITSQFAATVGYRYFKADNSLVGFYGYSLNYNSLSGYSAGMDNCFTTQIRVNGNPCTDLNKRVTETGHVPRYNLTYKITPDKLIYVTYSEGFRPGGVNRTSVAGIGPYAADYLKNYELGWKTQWLGHHLRWNGAFFWEDWNNFQFSFLGPNSLTIIENGGSARIKGVESELEWATGGGLVLSWNATLLDPRMTTNYCGFSDPNGNVVTSNDCTYPGEPPGGAFRPLAPAGTNLPVAPKFKTNAVARYSWAQGDWEDYAQLTAVYQTQVVPSLRTADVAVVGKEPAYALFDFTTGMERNGMSIQLGVTNLADRRAQLTRFVQSASALQPYVIPAQPRTVFLKFGQKF